MVQESQDSSSNDQKTQVLKEETEKVPEWSIGADCKSADESLRRFESYSSQLSKTQENPYVWSLFLKDLKDA